MTPKILLTGRSGQLGSVLMHALSPLGDVLAPGRHDLDLANPGSIRGFIRSTVPKVIVNAAAFTAVDRAETERAVAQALNADAPALMAEEAKRLGATLVHYSTDYVFDGTKRSPYKESDPPNPINSYGATKLAGEEAIRASGARHLILRTSWVYGTRGRNFLLTILKLATEREELRVVADQIGAPTWSLEIASATVRILAPLAALDSNLNSLSPASGTYHMTASGETSWYAFAQAILAENSEASPGAFWIAAAMGDRPAIARRVVPITTPEYPTLARRPAYSVLSNARFLQAFGFKLPGWREQLHSLFQST